MVFQIQIDSYFAKKYKKLVKNNFKLNLVVDQAITDLSENPLPQRLGSHKVNSPKFGSCFSSRVTGDIRIIWNYGVDGEVEILELLDIGGHGEVY